MKIASIPLAGAAVAGLASIVSGCPPAQAHDWYQLECCALNDCRPAGGIERDGTGGTTAIVGDLRIPIPESVIPRPSRDSQAHVCFRAYLEGTDGGITVVPICLFLPDRTAGLQSL